MKLRLTQSGFEHYTGQMGVIQFEDGLSTGDVLHIDATRVAGVMGAEWENGQPANVSQLYLDAMDHRAPTDEEQRAAANSDVPKSIDMDEVKEKAEALGKTYTEEELAAIADKEGINGLRAIADPLGVKGNSIRGLMDVILKAAGTPVTKAA
jgi:hypothetical protein